jgi:hypothetical protein
LYKPSSLTNKDICFRTIEFVEFTHLAWGYGKMGFKNAASYFAGDPPVMRGSGVWMVAADVSTATIFCNHDILVLLNMKSKVLTAARERY